MIYLGARRFLEGDHPFRRARAAFNNHTEWQMAPKRPTGEEILRWANDREEFLREGGVDNSENDPMKLHSVKCRSALFDLPYWQVCTVEIIFNAFVYIVGVVLN